MKTEDKKYILENINKKSIKDISHDINLKERKIRKFLERQKEEKKQIDPNKEPKTLLRKKTIFLSVILIIILGFTVYANSLKGDFLWDDEDLIIDNSLIKQWRYLPKLFVSPLTASFNKCYRPLANFSFMLDYSIWKLNPLGYHLTSVFIHVLNSCLVYFLIYLLSRDKILSLATGLIFSVHTLLSEPVNYISSRADLLVAFFFLSSIILYVKYWTSSLRRNFYYLGALLSFILALMSKEMAIALPFVLILYVSIFKSQRELPERPFLSLLYFFLILGAYVALRFTLLKFESLGPNLTLVEKSFTNIPIGNLGLIQRLFTSVKMIPTHLRLLLFPFGLHKEWLVKPVESIFQIQVMLSLVLIIAFFVLAKIIYSYSKIATFGILWFFLLLAPLLNIYPLNAFLSEAWLYLPAVGFILFGAAITLRFIQPVTMFNKFLLIFMFISILSYFSILTINRNKIWAGGPVVFYKDILKYNPYSANAHNDLGNAYSKQNKLSQAIAEYYEAINLDQNYIEAYNNLGTVYLGQGNLDQAMIEYKKAISINPNYAKARYNLGGVYLEQNSLDQAMIEFRKALNINPNNSDIYNNVGNIYYKQNKLSQSIIEFQKAITVNPSYANAYYNLGSAYRRLGQHKRARVNLKRAIELFHKQNKGRLARQAEQMLNQIP